MEGKEFYGMGWGEFMRDTIPGEWFLEAVRRDGKLALKLYQDVSSFSGFPSDSKKHDSICMDIICAAYNKWVADGSPNEN